MAKIKPPHILSDWKWLFFDTTTAKSSIRRKMNRKPIFHVIFSVFFLSFIHSHSMIHPIIRIRLNFGLFSVWFGSCVCAYACSRSKSSSCNLLLLIQFKTCGRLYVCVCVLLFIDCQIYELRLNTRVMKTKNEKRNDVVVKFQFKQMRSGEEKKKTKPENKNINNNSVEQQQQGEEE